MPIEIKSTTITTKEVIYFDHEGKSYLFAKKTSLNSEQNSTLAKRLVKDAVYLDDLAPDFYNTENLKDFNDAIRNGLSKIFRDVTKILVGN